MAAGTIVAIPLVIMVLLFQLDGIRSVAKPDGPELNWEGMMNYSMSDIIHHPIRMARVFFGTLLALGWDWYLQSIGRMLSGQTMAIKNAFVYVFGVLLLFSSFRHEDERPTSAREKLVFTITGLLPIFLLMFIMLISWTSNTRTTIQGIQGRYFIPVLPLFFMCLRTRLVTVRKPIERYIAFCGLLMDICVLLDVLEETTLTISTIDA